MSPLLILVPLVELINRFPFQIVPILLVICYASAQLQGCRIYQLSVSVFRYAGAFTSTCLGW